jgi:ParB/RepB/Spo0J family partition protein
VSITYPTADTPDQFAHVLLDHIVSSTTNPRKTFDHASLTELAESVRASGVHQPVLLRPLTGERLADTASMRPRPAYELVSGERRYRASELAGKPSIPAIIRALTDAQVLEIQIVENLQRADLAPLEEAEGYDHLRNHHEPPLSAEQIGERIGKSKSYVYGRLKLLALGMEGRQAMRDGWLDASRALLVARIPDTKVQAQALGNMRDYAGEPLRHTEASNLLRRQYMLRLDSASFNTKDGTLIAVAGSCNNCHKRSGADPDLFSDLKGETDLCLDAPCFKAKEQAHQDRLHQAARDSGATIIKGREAKALMPHAYTHWVDGYLRLDNPADSPTDKPLRSIIGSLMEEEGLTALLVANPHKEGELVAVIDHATASRLLAKKGHQEHADRIQANGLQSAKDAAQALAVKDKQAFEEGWRWAVLEAAWSKISESTLGEYTLSDNTVRHLAHSRIPNADSCKRLCKLLGLGTVAPASAVADWINDADTCPSQATALLLMFGDTEYRTWGTPESQVNQRLIDLATDVTGRAGVDIEAIKAQVKKEHTARIKARKKAQTEAVDAAAQKADLPQASAAQASGGRGADKTKTKPHAAPKPKAREAEVRQGIAAAMQGEEEEGRADDGPAGSDPAVASAGGEESPATSPDAHATPSALSPVVAWPSPKKGAR